MDLRVGTPVAELKSRCACYAEKEDIKLHSYSDEQVHLWTCRTIETLTGRSKRLSEKLHENEQVGS